MTRELRSYSLMQVPVWAINGSVYCFSSAYLLHAGLSNTLIGVLIGAAVCLCFLGQVFFGKVIGGGSKRSLTSFIIRVSSAMLVLSLLLLLKMPLFLNVFAFLTLCFLQQLLPAFINSAGIDAIQKGAPIDFGIGRGFGSMSFAIFSILTGTLITRFGYSIIFYLAALLSLALIVSAFHFRKVIKSYGPVSGGNGASSSEPAVSERGKLSFISAYKKYSVFLIGTAVIMLGHTFMSNFIFQIVSFKGGDTSSTGYAAAIAAFSEIPVMFVFFRLLKKLRCDTWLHISLFFLVIKMLMTYFASSVTGVYIAQLGQMPGFALFTVSGAYYTGTVISHDDVVKGQAYFNAASVLGVFLSLISGGLIIDRLGIQAMLLIGVAVMAVGAVIILFSTEKVTKPIGFETKN